MSVEELSLYLVPLMAVLIFLIGFAAGFTHFSTRYYARGYKDGVESGKARSLSFEGKCHDCGWQAEDDNLKAMLAAIVKHNYDCRARRR